MTPEQEKRLEEIREWVKSKPYKPWHKPISFEDDAFLLSLLGAETARADAAERHADRVEQGGCETCGAHLIDNCLRCGAPQCCPMCCRMAALEKGHAEACGVAHDWEDRSGKNLRALEACLKQRDEASKLNESVALLDEMTAAYENVGGYCEVTRHSGSIWLRLIVPDQFDNTTLGLIEHGSYWSGEGDTLDIAVRNTWKAWKEE